MNEAAIRRAAIGPWMALAAFIVLWVAMTAIGPQVRALIQPHVKLATPQDVIAFRLIFGLPFSWLALAGTIFILRLRGQGLADIGWRKPAKVWGWILAFSVVAFFLASSFHTPFCRGLCFIEPRAWATDWSVFRIAASVAIGVTAGVCEEISFRGFVMRQARDGGAPLPVQVLLSGLFFGLAHFGIAGLSGHFDPVAAVSVIASTTVFGAVFAVVYAFGGRSLTPVILAHGLFAFVTEPWLLLWTLNHAPH